MAVRSTTLQSLILSLAAIIAGCGYNQPNRFQMSFLPPAPKGAPAIELPDPPAVEPNAFLTDVPAAIVPKLPPPTRRTLGDDLMQRAERRMQNGKRFYQAKDLPSARR